MILTLETLFMNKYFIRIWVHFHHKAIFILKKMRYYHVNWEILFKEALKSLKMIPLFKAHYLCWTFNFKRQILSMILVSTSTLKLLTLLVQDCPALIFGLNRFLNQAKFNSRSYTLIHPKKLTCFLWTPWLRNRKILTYLLKLIFQFKYPTQILILLTS